MRSFTGLIFLYPYPDKIFAFIVTAIIVVIIGLPVYDSYRLINRKMNERTKTIFHRILKIAGICLFVIFFSELTVSLITMHNVNRQLGFNYATPDTPQGEQFLITRVVPGKTMGKAGLKRDDVVQMWSTDQLYKLLVNNLGKEVEFSVLRDDREIAIRVKVPEMDLPLRRVLFLF
jgi:hypothetical protein